MSPQSQLAHYIVVIDVMGVGTLTKEHYGHTQKKKKSCKIL